MTGCAPVIIDINPSLQERDRANKIKIAQVAKVYGIATPNYVKVADKDNIIVTAIKSNSSTGPQKIQLDTWKVTAVNHGIVAKCVTIDWKLMDFELTTNLPYEFLIRSQETLSVGKMTQTIWSFDDTALALPPSGYIGGMLVRDAEFDRKTRKLTCDMLENDIQTPTQESDK
jgi:hypothetical protein